MTKLIEQLRLSFGLWLLCIAVQKIMPKSHADTEVWRIAICDAAVKLSKYEWRTVHDTRVRDSHRWPR